MKYTAIIPAAGIGTRTALAYPKQYKKIAGKTILEHTISLFLNHESCRQVIVAIASNDDIWQTLPLTNHNKVRTVEGASERFLSVHSALRALQKEVHEQDWILVHDAVRPCLQPSQLEKFCQQLSMHPVGGFMAVPCADTLKKCDPSGQVMYTVDRENIWQAQSPQMFRYHLLMNCLTKARDSAFQVTDEASAIQQFSEMKVSIVPGTRSNFKITFNEDFAMATFLLENSEESICV